MSEPSIEGEPIARAVGCWLSDTGLTLAVAESCTGGLICDMLTDLPGSSAYFQCGVVAYSNRSKTRFLSVDPEIIHQFGAVSPQVAAGMAEGVARASGADLGLSTTGIAGPGGGSAEKPVGLVYIGVTGPLGTETVRKQFSGSRRQIKRMAALSALLLVEDYISRIIRPA